MQSQDKDRSDFAFKGHFHGDVSANLTGGEANADASASTNSSEVRDAYRQAVEQAVASQVSQTASSRKTQAQEVDEHSTTTNSFERIETFEWNNLANSSPVNLLICQLTVERLTALCLLNEQIGYFDPNTQQPVVKPMSSLSAIVNSVIVPEHREEVQKLLLQQISVVQDWQDNAREFVHKATGPSGEFFQVVPGLTTTVSVVRTNGAIKNFVVPGIAIHTMNNVLPIPQVALVNTAASV